MLNTKEFNLKSSIALREIASDVDSKDSPLIDVLFKGIRAELFALDLRGLNENDLRILSLRCNVFHGKGNDHFGGVLTHKVFLYLQKRQSGQAEEIEKCIKEAEMWLEEALENGEPMSEALDYVIGTWGIHYDYTSNEIAKEMLIKKYGE